MSAKVNPIERIMFAIQIRLAVVVGVTDDKPPRLRIVIPCPKPFVERSPSDRLSAVRGRAGGSKAIVVEVLGVISDAAVYVSVRRGGCPGHSLQPDLAP